jgi:hypothetical protein
VASVLEAAAAATTTARECIDIMHFDCKWLAKPCNQVDIYIENYFSV